MYRLVTLVLVSLSPPDPSFQPSLAEHWAAQHMHESSVAQQVQQPVAPSFQPAAGPSMTSSNSNISSTVCQVAPPLVPPMTLPPVVQQVQQAVAPSFQPAVGPPIETTSDFGISSTVCQVAPPPVPPMTLPPTVPVVQQVQQAVAPSQHSRSTPVVTAGQTSHPIAPSVEPSSAAAPPVTPGDAASQPPDIATAPPQGTLPPNHVPPEQGQDGGPPLYHGPVPYPHGWYGPPGPYYGPYGGWGYPEMDSSGARPAAFPGNDGQAHPGKQAAGHFDMRQFYYPGQMFAYPNGFQPPNAEGGRVARGGAASKDNK